MRVCDLGAYWGTFTVGANAVAVEAGLEEGRGSQCRAAVGRVRCRSQVAAGSMGCIPEALEYRQDSWSTHSPVGWASLWGSRGKAGSEGHHREGPLHLLQEGPGEEEPVLGLLALEVPVPWVASGVPLGRGWLLGGEDEEVGT